MVYQAQMADEEKAPELTLLNSSRVFATTKLQKKPKHQPSTSIYCGSSC